MGFLVPFSIHYLSVVSPHFSASAYLYPVMGVINSNLSFSCQVLLKNPKTGSFPVSLQSLTSVRRCSRCPPASLPPIYHSPVASAPPQSQQVILLLSRGGPLIVVPSVVGCQKLVVVCLRIQVCPEVKKNGIVVCIVHSMAFHWKKQVHLWFAFLMSSVISTV